MTAGNSSAGPWSATRPLAESLTPRIAPSVPRAADIHVVGHATYVVAGSGLGPWVITYRCPFDGLRHLSHHSHPDLPPVMRRKAACGADRLLIHPAERT